MINVMFKGKPFLAYTRMKHDDNTLIHKIGHDEFEDPFVEFKSESRHKVEFGEVTIFPETYMLTYSACCRHEHHLKYFHISVHDWL